MPKHIDKIKQGIKETSENIDELEKNQSKKANELRDLKKRVQVLAERSGIKLDDVGIGREYSRIVVDCNDIYLRSAQQFANNFTSDNHPESDNLDQLDRLDLFVMVVTGLAAIVTDFIFVGMPKKTHLTPNVEGSVIPEGYLAKAIKSWNMDSDNLLAKWFKVPFDRSTTPGMLSGINPCNHRFHSFGHDPSPLGAILGMLDMALGRMSGTTIDGRIFSIPTGIPAEKGELLLLPLLWLGHIISDAPTPMGVPMPGSSIFQLLRFKVHGVEGGPTIADVMRQLYQQGYDFRHYLVGALVPGLIEAVIRVYHFVRYEYGHSKSASIPIMRDIDQECRRIQLEAKLYSMLFWTHSFAAAANVGRVAIQGIATGNFFAAIKNINFAQWQIFAVRSLQYAAYKNRDTTVEKVLENRRQINRGWVELQNSPVIEKIYLNDDSANFLERIDL